MCVSEDEIHLSGSPHTITRFRIIEAKTPPVPHPLINHPNMPPFHNASIESPGPALSLRAGVPGLNLDSGGSTLRRQERSTLLASVSLGTLPIFPNKVIFENTTDFRCSCYENKVYIYL